MIGIYKITSPKGRVYIGQSRNIHNRFKHYRSGHCKGQIRLSNSFAKYGIDSHTFEVVELCTIKQLDMRERFWQEKFNVLSSKGMNCLYTEIPGKRGSMTKQTLRKRNLAYRRRNPLSVQHKDKISSSCKGRVVSKTTRLKMSVASKGIKKTTLHRQRISLSRKGIKMSETTKLKMRKPKTVDHILKISRSLGKRVQQLTLDGKLISNWFSASEAARVLGINHQGISACCNKKLRSYNNYLWRFESKT